MTISASIVVPTYRRHDMLRRCLEALVAQDYDAGYEIIVADDACDPDTRRFVDGFSGRQPRPLRYVEVGPKHGPAAARNAGWQTARGASIAFTDDDCVPHRSWLQRGVTALATAPAVSGRIVVPLPPSPTDYERDCAGLAHSEFVTANCFCRREILEEIGGFDENFTKAWREDSDLQFTLLERGYEIVNAPDTVVVHPVRPCYWGVSIAQQRKSEFNALLFKKHRQLYAQRIATSPRSYYVITLAIAGMLAGALTGTATLWLASTACWGALTARFCRRRLRGTSRAPSHIAEMVFTSIVIPPLSLYWRIRGAVRHRVLFW